MSEVTLAIGGRTYRVTCAPGEEERVSRLGATIAEKLASLGNPTGPDAQNLLFASLLLADEVLEAREGHKDPGAPGDPSPPADWQAERDHLTTRITALEGEQARLESAQRDAADAIAEREAQVAELEKELAELRATPSPSADRSAVAELTPALEQFAQMLEECADKLERRAPAP